jgi:hypothetical protein
MRILGSSFHEELIFKFSQIIVIGRGDGNWPRKEGRLLGLTMLMCCDTGIDQTSCPQACHNV